MYYCPNCTLMLACIVFSPAVHEQSGQAESRWHLRVGIHAGKLLMQLEQLDELGPSLRHLHHSSAIFIRSTGELVRSAPGAESVVLLLVLQDANVWIT